MYFYTILVAFFHGLLQRHLLAVRFVFFCCFLRTFPVGRGNEFSLFSQWISKRDQGLRQGMWITIAALTAPTAATAKPQRPVSTFSTFKKWVNHAFLIFV